jgi:hypothetical protein
LHPFIEQRTILLTTFKRDGSSVGTPVNIAVDPADHSRFLLTAPPLRLPGAVGSPVTPVPTV